MWTVFVAIVFFGVVIWVMRENKEEIDKAKEKFGGYLVTSNHGDVFEAGKITVVGDELCMRFTDRKDVGSSTAPGVIPLDELHLATWEEASQFLGQRGWSDDEIKSKLASVE